MNRKMIRLEKVSKIYKCGDEEIKALNEVSMEITDGEFVFILGKSGSGKTTLLNIIGMLSSVTNGKYYLNDLSIDEMTEKNKERVRKDNIGFVFQHFELLNNYTIYENIEMPLIPRNIGKKQRRKKVYDLTEQLDIKELLNKFPDELSGGQKQRAAIARALITGNPVILADEPTGALDSKTSEKLMEILSEINSQGRTIICVTHNEDLIKYGSRVIMLEDGAVISDKKG